MRPPFVPSWTAAVAAEALSSGGRAAWSPSATIVRAAHAPGPGLPARTARLFLTGR
jgi:hypothetical protein